MKIAIGSDHIGFRYKERIRLYLETLGHEVRDYGTYSETPVDYPEFVRAVAAAVAGRQVERGIVVGESGIGEAIAANRHVGIRCALCWNSESAKLGRQHDDANAVSVGAGILTIQMALEILKVWLDTPFDGGRHERRIKLIDQHPRVSPPQY